MPAQRLVGAILLVAAAAAPSEAQDAGAELDLSVYAGVTFPTDVGDFQALRVTRWPDASLGIGITYVIPRFPGNFSLYVYPAVEDLEAEFETAMDEVGQYTEQNGLTMEVDSTGPAMVAGIEGFVGITELTGPRGSSRSLVYVFEKDAAFLKYRFTYDPAMRTIIRERLDDLIETTLSTVRVRDPSNDG